MVKAETHSSFGDILIDRSANTGMSLKVINSKKIF